MLGPSRRVDSRLDRIGQTAVQRLRRLARPEGTAVQYSGEVSLVQAPPVVELVRLNQEYELCRCRERLGERAHVPGVEERCGTRQQGTGLCR